VIGVPATTDISETLKNITEAKPDFVFNMVEEIGGNRHHDGLIVQILELMRIPFTGASYDTLMVARNKELAKLVVANAGVAVPKGVVIFRDLEFLPGDVTFPAILKPAYTDGSEGVTAKSYVKTVNELQRRLKEFRRWLPVLCEEYIPGREIIVTASGTKRVAIDSICEMVFPQKAPVRFATSQAKFDAKYRERFGIVYKTPTQLKPPLNKMVVAAARKAYRALRINSYAKLEFRVSDERVVFIEANPNSQMNRFAKSTDFSAIGYENFIRKIVRMAMRRGRR
jgi:D-alanine-D-alanine ligase